MNGMVYCLCGLDGQAEAMDGAGIDVWVGSAKKQVDAIMCIVDLMKRDSEIKILIVKVNL